jgi:hypothetical protein
MDSSNFITLRGVLNTTSIARCRTGAQFAIGAGKGSVLMVADGETSRAYEPEMRSLEFESQLTSLKIGIS